MGVTALIYEGIVGVETDRVIDEIVVVFWTRD